MRINGPWWQEFSPRYFCSIGEGQDGAPGGGGSGATGSPSSGSSSGNAGSSSSPGSGAPTSAAAPAAPASSAGKATTTPGTPSPGSSASTPSTPSTPHALATAGEGGPADSFNFDEIFTLTDPSILDAAAPAAAVPDGQAPAPQPATPVAQPGVEPGAQPASPAAAPAVAPSPSPRETSPAPSPADPAGLARALIQHENEAIQHMATQFVLSEAEVQALETDIIGTLPSIMSKVFVRAQQTMFANMAKIVPAMLEQHGASTRANQEAESQFFGQWPKLNKAAHGESVKRLASAYRMANPSVTREQMMRDVGMLVMMQSGIALDAPGAAQPQSGVPNGVPVQLPKPAQMSPWQPAGAAPATSATAGEGNPWDILAQHEPG